MGDVTIKILSDNGSNHEESVEECVSDSEEELDLNMDVSDEHPSIIIPKKGNICMASTSDFKNGLIFERKNQLWKIVEFQHVKPGKGPAFVRTKIRNLNTGRLLENTFTSGVKIDIIRVENRKYQF